MRKRRGGQRLALIIPKTNTRDTHVRKPPWGSLMATQRGSVSAVGSFTRWKWLSCDRLPDMWTASEGEGGGAFRPLVNELFVRLKHRRDATHTGRGS